MSEERLTLIKKVSKYAIIILTMILLLKGNTFQENGQHLLFGSLLVLLPLCWISLTVSNIKLLSIKK